MDMSIYDVAIIGGGINGCACAADAAIRGLYVFLCEQDDLASKTSSSSTKLIHGGLRYVELGHFSLVKKALRERQLLLDNAPHLVHPLSFMLPHHTKLRPLWLIRIGLFLYDHLTRSNRLPKSKRINRQSEPNYFQALNAAFTDGFLYYDAATDDARLTITNALQAKKYGAQIVTQTQFLDAQASDGIWTIRLKPKIGPTYQIKAKSIINAAGPWVNLVNESLNIPLHHPLSLVKGSHIIVNALYSGDYAYLLQHDDKRIVFVIPYHGYSLIGTTEVRVSPPIEDVAIETSEIDYLFNTVKSYFNISLTTQDIVQTWSGIRPLINDSEESRTTSRDYCYYYSQNPAPSITIYSGKLTTHRQLALEVINQLRSIFPNLPDSKTHLIRLPGAEFEDMSWSDYSRFARDKYAWLDTAILSHYLESYGTRTELILKNCKNLADLGQRFSDTLFQVEVEYLIQEEWAVHASDIIWRRTKLGLTITDAQSRCLEEYLDHQQTVFT